MYNPNQGWNAAGLQQGRKKQQQPGQWQSAGGGGGMNPYATPYGKPGDGGMPGRSMPGKPEYPGMPVGAAPTPGAPKPYSPRGPMLSPGMGGGPVQVGAPPIFNPTQPPDGSNPYPVGGGYNGLPSGPGGMTAMPNLGAGVPGSPSNPSTPGGPAGAGRWWSDPNQFQQRLLGMMGLMNQANQPTGPNGQGLGQVDWTPGGPPPALAQFRQNYNVMDQAGNRIPYWKLAQGGWDQMRNFQNGTYRMTGPGGAAIDPAQLKNYWQQTNPNLPGGRRGMDIPREL